MHIHIYTYIHRLLLVALATARARRYRLMLAMRDRPPTRAINPATGLRSGWTIARWDGGITIAGCSAYCTCWMPARQGSCWVIWVLGNITWNVTWLQQRGQPLMISHHLPNFNHFTSSNQLFWSSNLNRLLVQLFFMIMQLHHGDHEPSAQPHQCGCSQVMRVLKFATWFGAACSRPGRPGEHFSAGNARVSGVSVVWQCSFDEVRYWEPITSNRVP